MRSLKFLLAGASGGHSKTAAFSGLFTLVLTIIYPFSWWLNKPLPEGTVEILGVLWGSYIGSNKVTSWVKANKKRKPCEPPEDENGKDDIPKP